MGSPGTPARYPPTFWAGWGRAGTPAAAVATNNNAESVNKLMRHVLPRHRVAIIIVVENIARHLDFWVTQILALESGSSGIGRRNITQLDRLTKAANVVLISF